VIPETEQFKPEETVKLSGTLKSAIGVHIAGESIEISISDPTGAVVFTTTLTTASNGSF